MKRSFLLLFLLLFIKAAPAQFFCGIRWVGVSAHLQKSKSTFCYKHRLSSSGRYVFSLGWSLMAGYKTSSGLGAELIQGFIHRDCEDKILGMTHLGLLYDAEKLFSNGLDFGGTVGPMWFYRQSWENIPGYYDDHTFSVSANGKWQKKFVWCGGQVFGGYNDAASGLKYRLNVLPGIPEIITIAPGIDVDIGKKH